MMMAERINTPMTNEHFAAFCLSMLGQPYWYGCVMYKCTESLRARKAKQYPDHYGPSRTARYRDDIAKKKVYADCVGGAKGYAWTGGGAGVAESIGNDRTFTNKYGANGCPDKSANGMFAYARSKGMDWGGMDTLPEIVGLALHKDGHIGYYVGNGYAVEWRGFSYGCVRTKVKDRGWKYWYKLLFIDYNDGAASVAPPVKAMQELLMQLGYELPRYGADSDFGEETEKAVIAFQKAEGLEADGKYGEKTHAALMDAVADDDAGKKDDKPEEEPAEPTEPEEPKPVGTTVVIVAEGGGKVNVRVGNDTSYKRITTVPAGTTFEYVAIAANGWNAVAVAGQVGWVSGKYSMVV